MLADYVEWQMRALLAPMLFDEDDWESARHQQKSMVKAAKSARTKAKARTKRTADNLPLHSFETLLADLSTLSHNEILGTIEIVSVQLLKFTKETNDRLDRLAKEFKDDD
jgi:hypothetical protein